jgi:hypothetical protein
VRLMEQDQNGHDFTRMQLGHTVALTLSRGEQVLLLRRERARS